MTVSNFAPRITDLSPPHVFVPFLPVHQSHGLEAGAVLDLSGHGLGALDAALGDVEGNVHAGGDGPRHQADSELPQELQGRVLVKKRRYKIKELSTISLETFLEWTPDVKYDGT